jgi:hypothetical protein
MTYFYILSIIVGKHFSVVGSDFCFSQLRKVQLGFIS